MKVQEKKIARTLRKQGWSLGDIRRKLKVAKSSVSIWVRDIELTKEQRQGLSERGTSREIIERRRDTRLKHENSRRQIIIDAAKKEIKSLSEKELKFVGIALYWAEGSKTQRGIASFSNADPNLIKVMMQFFRKICKVPESKFRGHIFLHPHLDPINAVQYWHNISNIPVKQFFKTSMQQSKSSKNKKDSLPFGTMNIEICSTELFLRIKGWTEGLSSKIINNK